MAYRDRDPKAAKGAYTLKSIAPMGAKLWETGQGAGRLLGHAKVSLSLSRSSVVNHKQNLSNKES